jgi:hypothetical protein
MHTAPHPRRSDACGICRSACSLVGVLRHLIQPRYKISWNLDLIKAAAKNIARKPRSRRGSIPGPNAFLFYPQWAGAADLGSGHELRCPRADPVHVLQAGGLPITFENWISLRFVTVVTLFGSATGVPGEGCLNALDSKNTGCARGHPPGANYYTVHPGLSKEPG